MDAAGVDRQVISLTAPGTQVLSPGAAVASEIERGHDKLGLNGVIINAHTHGEYLDNPRFWPIFEAAEALGTPIYLHPSTPPRNMIGPLLDAGLDGAIYGFAVDTAMH